MNPKVTRGKKKEKEKRRRVQSNSKISISLMSNFPRLGNKGRGREKKKGKGGNILKAMTLATGNVGDTHDLLSNGTEREEEREGGEKDI